MKIATLAIITREKNGKEQVLLGRKQGGPEIGEGTLNGPGGKMEHTDKTLLDCVKRESLEEFGIILDPAKTEKVAVITFHAGGVPDFEVHIYRTSTFSGEPHETESMVLPEWHDTDKIPFERMLESDHLWFPRAIRGKKFHADVYYRERAKGFENIEFLPFVDSD